MKRLMEQLTESDGSTSSNSHATTEPRDKILSELIQEPLTDSDEERPIIPEDDIDQETKKTDVERIEGRFERLFLDIGKRTLEKK